MIREFDGQYRFLSNFYSCDIWYEDACYPSVENAYQAAQMKKHTDCERFYYIKASEAKKLGRVLPIRDGSEVERLNVMLDLVRQKFTTYPNLKEKLLATG